MLPPLPEIVTTFLQFLQEKGISLKAIPDEFVDLPLYKVRPTAFTLQDVHVTIFVGQAASEKEEVNKIIPIFQLIAYHYSNDEQVLYPLYQHSIWWRFLRAKLTGEQLNDPTYQVIDEYISKIGKEEWVTEEQKWLAMMHKEISNMYASPPLEPLALTLAPNEAPTVFEKAISEPFNFGPKVNNWKFKTDAWHAKSPFQLSLDYTFRRIKFMTDTLELGQPNNTFKPTSLEQSTGEKDPNSNSDPDNSEPK